MGIYRGTDWVACHASTKVSCNHIFKRTPEGPTGIHTERDTDSMSAIRTARPAVLSKQFFSRENLTSDNAILVYLALAGVVAHLLVSNHYGYFRDELYYM